MAGEERPIVFFVSRISLGKRRAMDRHIRTCLNRASYVFAAIASFILVLLYLRTPDTCVPLHLAGNPHLRFPKSSCDHNHREYQSLDRKNHRLWSTHSWQKRVSSLAQLFASIRDLTLLSNQSHVLCVSAGAGHEVMALHQMDVSEVTGVEITDSPPLVSRADPHNLPFFDGVFDLSFSAHLTEALFPSRYAAELERVVGPGGACVVVVEECDDEDVKQIVRLFRNSELVQAKKGSLTGSKVTRIIMRRIQIPA